MKTVAPNATDTHFMFHQQVLAMKTLPPALKQIMSHVMQSVNFIESSALNSRLFNKLCFQMDPKSTQL
jgi:hypothetical protein